jgi:hypothetical protein
MNDAAQITFTPGTLISRLASEQESIWRAINLSTSAISASRNSTWRMHPSTVSASSTASSNWRSHWRPPTPNRSLTGGRPFNRRIRTAWTSFIDRDRTNCSRRARRRRNTRVSSCPHPVKLPGRQQPRQRPRVQAVGPRARPADPRLITTDHDHPRHTRLEDRQISHQPPVTSNATLSVGKRALSQHPKRLRHRRNPTRRADLPLLADRDLTKIQVHVQPDRSTDRLHDQPPNVE